MEKKIDYKHGKFVILTSDADPDNYCYEDYVDWCDANGIEPGGRNSDEYREWIMREAEESYESDLENIRSHRPYMVPVVITGALGLWWGRPEIKPVREESVYDAIQRCIGRNGEMVTAEFNDGKIDVSVSHNDGTNCFTIRALSKRGAQRKSGEYEERDFKRFNYLYA